MSYVTYDDRGLKEVRCTNCGEVVGKRVYLPTKDKNVKAVSFKRLANWKQRKFKTIKNDRESGFIEPILCNKCLNSELDTEKIFSELLEGWKSELRATGTPESEIETKMKIYDGMRIA